jgi:hypothetical protein
MLEITVHGGTKPFGDVVGNVDGEFHILSR